MDDSSTEVFINGKEQDVISPCFSKLSNGFLKSIYLFGFCTRSSSHHAGPLVAAWDL